MVRNVDEIMETVRSRIGDSDDDETLSFIEDLSDTFNDFQTKTSDATDWKKKYEDNDKEWRQKYRDRFFSGNNPDDTTGGNDENNVEPPKKMKYEDLFTSRKEND